MSVSVQEAEVSLKRVFDNFQAEIMQANQRFNNTSDIKFYREYLGDAANSFLIALKNNLENKIFEGQDLPNDVTKTTEAIKSRVDSHDYIFNGTTFQSGAYNGLRLLDEDAEELIQCVHKELEKSKQQGDVDLSSGSTENKTSRFDDVLTRLKSQRNLNKALGCATEKLDVAIGKISRLKQLEPMLEDEKIQSFCGQFEKVIGEGFYKTEEYYFSNVAEPYQNGELGEASTNLFDFCEKAKNAMGEHADKEIFFHLSGQVSNLKVVLDEYSQQLEDPSAKQDLSDLAAEIESFAKTQFPTYEKFMEEGGSPTEIVARFEPIFTVWKNRFEQIKEMQKGPKEKASENKVDEQSQNNDAPAEEVESVSDKSEPLAEEKIEQPKPEPAREPEKTYRSQFDVNNDNDFNRLLAKYAKMNVTYYDGHKRTPEEVKKRRNLNAQMKKILKQKEEQSSENGQHVSRFVEGQFSSMDIEEIANDKQATIKLFLVLASGVYQDKTLTQKQRQALAGVMEKVSEKRLDMDFGVVKQNAVEPVQKTQEAEVSANGPSL